MLAAQLFGTTAVAFVRRAWTDREDEIGTE
jgi:hypothetical protein